MLGILLALLAFYLTFKKNKRERVILKYAFIPLFLFLAVGIFHSMLKVAEHFYIGKDLVVFLATAFGFALLFGMIVLLFLMVAKKMIFQIKNVVAGVILGLLNWYSTFYFLKGLNTFQVSVFVPVFNVGVVVLSSIVGLILFKEKLGIQNRIGIIIAIVAIVLIANA